MSGARCIEEYDPMLFSSPEDYAASIAVMEQDLGIPSQPHTGRIGMMVNELHFKQAAARRDEFGWHGTTPAQLRASFGLS